MTTNTAIITSKPTKAYLLLVLFIFCGLALSTVTASKIIHIGINFPFCNLVFSVFTYPMFDCICELWGKKLAQRTIWFGLGFQLLTVALLQLSIELPHAAFWHQQPIYQTVLASSSDVVIASLLAFAASQILDVLVYQKLKELSKGKKLWLRSNLSTFAGQIIDSSIFVSIVFASSAHKLNILLGSISIKVIISILMTPLVYLIVISIDKYLQSNTLAFQSP